MHGRVQWAHAASMEPLGWGNAQDRHLAAAAARCWSAGVVGVASGQRSTADAELGFVMKAKRPIAQGEELRYSYGADLCKERALLVYGFALDGMPACENM